MIKSYRKIGYIIDKNCTFKDKYGKSTYIEDNILFNRIKDQEWLFQKRRIYLDEINNEVNIERE